MLTWRLSRGTGFFSALPISWVRNLRRSGRVVIQMHGRGTRDYRPGQLWPKQERIGKRPWQLQSIDLCLWRSLENEGRWKDAICINSSIGLSASNESSLPAEKALVHDTTRNHVPWPCTNTQTRIMPPQAYKSTQNMPVVEVKMLVL